MTIQHLKKMHSMCKALSVDEAVDEIKGPSKVNEVIPKVAAEDRSKVFNQLRMEKATELQKQAQPVGGVFPGIETRPTNIQTSAQTAGSKMAMSVSKESLEKQQGLSQGDLEALAEQEQHLKEMKNWHGLAEHHLDLGRTFEKLGDLETARDHFKNAHNYYNKHIEESASKQISSVPVMERDKKGKLSEQQADIKNITRVSPQLEQVTTPRTFSPDVQQKKQQLASAKQQIASAEAKTKGPTSLTPQLMEAMKKDPKYLDKLREEGHSQLRNILGDLDPDALQEDLDTKFSRIKNDPDAMEELRQFIQWTGKNDKLPVSSDAETAEPAEGKVLSPKEKMNLEEAKKIGQRQAVKQRLQEIVGQPENIPSEFLQDQELRQTGKKTLSSVSPSEFHVVQNERGKPEVQLKNVFQQQATPYYTGSGYKQTRLGGIAARLPRGEAARESEQQAQKWLEAKAKGEGRALQTKPEQAVASRPTPLSELSPEERSKIKVKPPKPAARVTAPGVRTGGAEEYAKLIAEQQARAATAAAQKQGIASESIPSAGTGVGAMTPKLSMEDKIKLASGKKLSQMTGRSSNTEKSLDKSAEQAKNPSFPKKPKEGAVAGNIPESDIVDDYSKRMESQKTINDKPVTKQGFGSVEKLKKAHTLLKNK